MAEILHVRVSHAWLTIRTTNFPLRPKA